MASNEMVFFPANFMLQTPHHHEITSTTHEASSNSLTTILPPCSSHQECHGTHESLSLPLGKRSFMSFPGVEFCEETNAEDEFSDDGSQTWEKKRRLNMEQVKTLEKNFELRNKLEPERKMQLARALGLQPRQIAIWFQNRRARWKIKQMEKDYDVLKEQYEAMKAENQKLQAHNKKLHDEVLSLNVDREPIEAINLNKETEMSSSNRSEDNSEIQLDISMLPAMENDQSTHPTSRSFFPTTRRPEIQCQKMEQIVKDESLSNMFCNMDEQSGLWPWLEQQQFN